MFAKDRPSRSLSVWYQPSKYKTWWGWYLATILLYPYAGTTRPANWKGWLSEFLGYIVPIAATIVVLMITDVSTFWGLGIL